MKPLPVDAVLPELLGALARAGAVVLQAPTGSGKTTRVPPALLDAGIEGEIVVLEPRRLAARLAAEHVARERGEAVGETVGYTVRFDDRRGPRTRLRYVTTGVLLRGLPERPDLRGIGALVFDELHERHLDDDLLLAWARRLRATSRPDLRIVAMSATLDPAPVAAFLGAEVVRSEGRTFPVTIEHAARLDTRPLSAQVASTVRRIVEEGLDGDVLVFLPGVDAIERCRSACRAVAEEARLELVALHGSMSPEATRAALVPRPIRKVILATNVAESSVTLEGVAAVIDSGLHKVMRSSPWTGLSHLREEPVPRDSAEQRAGRAGRTRPGRCLRLYVESDLRSRPACLDPEVRRADLAPASLLLAALEAEGLTWLDAPQEAAWTSARALLVALGALDARGLTPPGRALLTLPLHPRLGVLLREATRLGHADAGALAAALLAEDVRLPDGLPESDSDVLALMAAFRERRLDAALRDRVARAAKDLGARGPPRGTWEEGDAVRRALLFALADRVARRKDRESFALVGGREVRLDRRSTVREARFVVAIDAEGGQHPLVRLCSAVEPDWLLDLPGDDLTEEVEVRWDEAAERVEASRTLRWRGLVLDASKVPSRGLAETTALLRRQARIAGAGRFADMDAVAQLRDRRRFAHSVDPSVPTLDDEAILATLDALCEGAAGFRDLKDANLIAALSLDAKTRRRLDQLAPERVPLASGRHARVRYLPEGRPRVAAPVQHFFGMTDGPRLGDGRVPALLELLAPSGRPVQLTDDLAGFWVRTWPEVRRELRGRYPRHKWPEDPPRNG